MPSRELGGETAVDDQFMPVTYLDSSEARNSMAWAVSQPWPWVLGRVHPDQVVARNQAARAAAQLRT